MNEVPVAVLEEDEPVALIFVRRSNEFDALRLEVRASPVKIIHGDRNVPDARCAHLRLDSGPSDGMISIIKSFCALMKKLP